MLLKNLLSNDYWFNFQQKTEIALYNIIILPSSLPSWSLILCQNVESGRDIMQNQLPSEFLAKLLNKDVKVPIYISWQEKEYF